MTHEKNVENLTVEAPPHVWERLTMVCIKAARTLESERLEYRNKRRGRLCPSCREQNGDPLDEIGAIDTSLVGVQQWKDIGKLLSRSVESSIPAIRELLTNRNFISKYVDVEESLEAMKAQGLDPRLFGLSKTKIPSGLFTEKEVTDEQKTKKVSEAVPGEKIER